MCVEGSLPPEVGHRMRRFSGPL